ncbi:hypothetical protein CRE_17825 [Caenorhabditis remanei]|uniref:Uncharacterized protein n=1 Tax=Caenorhabditis remanei TaxID=31234 RepID=E3MDJ4_CAERE|nr:hypothetical protein CRE_17825 [Caenorhabditis remanei]
MQSHMLLCPGPKYPYGKEIGCSQCYYTSQFPKRMIEHLKLHRDGSLTCEMCMQKFDDKHTLYRHRKTERLQTVHDYICRDLVPHFQPMDYSKYPELDPVVWYARVTMESTSAGNTQKLTSEQDKKIMSYEVKREEVKTARLQIDESWDGEDYEKCLDRLFTEPAQLADDNLPNIPF